MLLQNAANMRIVILLHVRSTFVAGEYSSNHHNIVRRF